MTSYLVLLRGINVGGKNKVPMAQLREALEDAGFSNVSTYIASGNVFLDSDLGAAKVAEKVEAALPKAFKLDSELVRVAVLSGSDLEAVIERRPKGFGDEPGKYHSDAIFLMGIDADEAMAVFSPKEGVDTVWPGDGVIYSQRLSARRTASRLNRIMVSPLYKSMTIRSWQTTLALRDLMRERSQGFAPPRRIMVREMTVRMTPRGTRGTKPPGFARPLMNLMARPYAAAVKRPGSKMRVAGQPLLVLTTIGATSGRERQTVLGYWADQGERDGSILVIGSNMGAATHPGWLFNMARHPDQVWIERNGARERVVPETLEGEERAAFWTDVVARNARYAKYQEQTDREIPIVRLRPIKET